VESSSGGKREEDVLRGAPSKREDRVSGVDGRTGELRLPSPADPVAHPAICPLRDPREATCPRRNRPDEVPLVPLIHAVRHAMTGRPNSWATESLGD